MIGRKLGIGLFLSILGVFVSLSVAPACPFCMEEKGPTLSGDFNDSSLVLYGTFKEFRPGVGLDDSQSDFEIETVLKAHPRLKELAKGKMITLPRGVQPNKAKFLVFINVFKGNLDPFRGVETTNGDELVKYLTGAMAHLNKPVSERLRYAFDFLNSGEFEVSMDAYREFARADYKDYKDIAAKFPPEVLVGWLKDPKTSPTRYGLYASLLGHCGKAEHAKVLREMLEDPEKRRGSGLDGLLAGQIMIQPKEGWDYLTSLLKDSSQDFLVRYACLRTIRFLWEQRPDLVSQKDLVDGMAIFLTQPDMADFGIEDLRKLKRWEMTDKVLGLFNKENYDTSLIKRSILRFALQCPEKKAVDFVDAQRRRDAEWVRDALELLQYDAQANAPTPKTGSKKK